MVWRRGDYLGEDASEAAPVFATFARDAEGGLDGATARRVGRRIGARDPRLREAQRDAEPDLSRRGDTLPAATLDPLARHPPPTRNGETLARRDPDAAAIALDP